MKELPQINWHELPEAEAAALLECDPATGLTQAEVEARLRQFGPNQMTAQRRLSEWMRFLLQFHQPLIYILLVSAAITAGLGKWVDAAVIFGVTVANAIIGYIQEAKAEKAIGALAKMIVTEATVRRGGEKVRRLGIEGEGRDLQPVIAKRGSERGLRREGQRGDDLVAE